MHIVGGLLLALFVGYVLLNLFFFLFKVAVLCVIPVLVSFATFHALRAMFVGQFAKQVEARIESLIRLQSEAGKLKFEPNRDSFSDVPKSEFIDNGPILAAGALLGTIIYFMASKEYLSLASNGANPFNTVFAFLLSFVGFGLLVRLSRSSHEDLVANTLSERIALLNEQATSVEKLDEALAANNKLRAGLQVPLRDGWKVALLPRIQTELRSILVGSTSLQHILDAARKEVTDESGHLSNADALLVQVLQAFDEATAACNRARNLALFNYLDVLYRGIDTLRLLLTQSRWEEFQSHATEALTELRRLASNADSILTEEEQSAESQVAPSAEMDNPYLVLGVREDLAIDEIKHVYRALANLYHPDHGRVSDHYRFQNINAAWEAIQRDRGLV